MVYRTFWFNARSSATIGLMDCLMRDEAGVVDDLDPFYEINLCDPSSRASVRKVHTDTEEMVVDESVCGDHWEVVTVAFVDGKTINVGYGTVPNENLFLTWTDDDPLEVNYVAVKTGDGFDGHWMLNRVDE